MSQSDLADPLLQRANEARDFITSKRIFQPQVAIVLGSGLSGLAELTEHAVSLPFSDIPGFPATNASGHPGNLILGYLSGLPVVLLQGRAHRYEGWANSDVQFPVYCLKGLGCQTLVTTNAAGGLNSDFRCGDLLAIDSHINMLWSRHTHRARQSAELDSTHEYPGTGVLPYSESLIQSALSYAHSNQVQMHRGCYLATLGPTYETKSEYRMFQLLGADAVGMSTVPEVLAAHKLKMQVVAFSVITNVAFSGSDETSHEEVIQVGNSAGPKLMTIIQHLLEDLSGQPD